MSEIATDVTWRVATRLFGPHRVSGVEVSEEVDDDGDEVLRVKLGMPRAHLPVDPALASTVPRRLRSELERAGEFGFPVIDYVPESALRR